MQVKRHRSRDLKVAADVTVDFANALDGLPADAYEFLGAVLGVNGKSFLNVFCSASASLRIRDNRGAIDGLAKAYIDELIGKGFDALAAKTELDEFLARVNRVVTSYETARRSGRHPVRSLLRPAGRS